MFSSHKNSIMIRNPNIKIIPGCQIGRRLVMPISGGMFTALATIFLALLLTGCTKETSSESVELIATQFFDVIQKKNYDKALGFYSDDFFALKPESSWVDYLKHVNGALGDLKKVKLKRKNISTVFSGRRFVFVFSNQYEKGLAKETVIFFKHISKPGVKIQVHTIESSKLPGSGTRR